MLVSLRLQNFRRHADTEVRLDDNAQIVLIAGTNGVGKSTLVEAITYGLYGEGRHGHKYLDRLVRRGAELEGMEVEIEFTSGGTTYRVKRRRDSKVSTAVLYGNEHALVEGARAVTAEVGRIFGMDCAGFRLAVIAQQKELDGLASLTPARRAEQLSRLLRLDAISKARDEARRIFNTERSVVQAMGQGEDQAAAEAAVVAARSALAGAQAAVAESNAALVQLEAELATSVAIEAAYRRAENDLARAEGVRATAAGELERLEAELAGIAVPDEVADPGHSLVEIATELAGVERDVAKGEAARAHSAQHAMVAAEAERVSARLDRVDEALAAGGGSTAVAAQMVTAEAELERLGAVVAQRSADRQELRDRYTETSARLSMLGERSVAAAGLGPVCGTCGQDIDEEHRRRQAGEAGAARAALEAEAGEIKARGEAVNAELAALEHQRLGARAELDELARLAGELRALDAERPDLVRRRDTYLAQLARTVVEPFDLDELYARKGELAVAAAAAQQAAEACRVREAVVARRASVQASVDAARQRLELAAGAEMGAAIDADLEAAYARRQEVVASRDAELEMSRSCTTEAAVTTERLASCVTGRDRAVAALDSRRAHQFKAVTASNAARVLSDVEERLAVQIRPALEGSIAQVLGQLSEGRFNSVKVDAEYNISVSEEGSYRPLSEFSGGEMDLISLAVRLALASVVAERHGSGGAGFLVLDECFGSQDPGRRLSILAALRNLRSTYGQILLISHVGGLEDAADTVIDVGAETDDQGSRIATVAA